MNPCADLELLVSLRAAGALEGEDAARLEAHLAGCPSCRADAAAAAEALALAALPPVSDIERRTLRDLPARALEELHRVERRHGVGKRIAAGVAVVAVTAVFVLAPAMLQRRPTVVPADEVAQAWEAPDLDALWEDAAVLDVDALASSDDAGDAASAALDF